MLPPHDAELSELEASLDAASPEARERWIRQFNRGKMLSLFNRLEGRVADPSYTVGEKGEQEWIGQNTVPVFTTFAKAFARHGGRIQGYNVNSGLAAWFGGPGHFLLLNDPEHGGQLTVDYTWEPDAAPAHWPGPVSNLKGTYTLVYGHMKDVLRPLGHNILVGEAYVKGKPRGFSFIMSRK